MYYRIIYYMNNIRRTKENIPNLFIVYSTMIILLHKHIDFSELTIVNVAIYRPNVPL